MHAAAASPTPFPVWASPTSQTPLDLGIEWDAENRLTAVKQGGSTQASFTYDGNGRRATKSAGGVTTTYVYDGAQFLEERPGAGTTKRYAYSPGIDRPLARDVAGTISYFVADHLGSITQMTDSAGAPTLTREYDPWGNLLQGSTTGGYAFTGREWEQESGLYYYRGRYYDPRAGRFSSEDPAGVGGGVNLYAYADNAPVRLTDPLGLKPGDRFKTRDAAVLDVFGWMKQWPGALRIEWGGKVCKDKDDCYSCSSPLTIGMPDKVATNMSPCVGGRTEVGFYHNHPSGGPTSVPDMLSAGDRRDYAVYTWRTGNNDWRVQRWIVGEPGWNPDGTPYFGTTIGTIRP